jgi:hypothetical protein
LYLICQFSFIVGIERRNRANADKNAPKPTVEMPQRSSVPQSLAASVKRNILYLDLPAYLSVVDRF